jgi:D-arabinose 1-dehydrogenase-like Zn-dependent alcohol dehydrogenase
MTSIRVATFDGPGAPAVIRQVQRPEVPAKAALIQIGACGVCVPFEGLD